jgi:hypothetical protein
MSRRRITRAAAVAVVALAAGIGMTPVPSAAEAPQATGWWSRRAPLQGEPGAETSGGGEVTGLASRGAVVFGSAATPAQQPPIDIPVPDGEGEGTAPPTTVPLPVPPPTVPDLPVPVPDEPGPGTQNPTVPDGGLWVANDPSGPIAISALRFRGDIGGGDLLLRFAPGSTTAGPIVACPALSPFQPVEGGAWPDRPAHDCDRMSLTGRRTADGTGMEWSIPQGFLPFGERVLDIVLLPDETRGDAFSVYFEAPGPETLTVTQGQELPPPAPELPDLDPTSLPTPASETFTDNPTFTDSATFDDVPVAEPPGVEAATPVDEPQLAAAPTRVSSLFEPFTESRTARIISVAVLLLMGAALWLFGGRSVREPKLLGALAASAPAVRAPQGPSAHGIGRFRRERQAKPGRL